MAQSSGGKRSMYLVIGALIVVAGVLAYMLWQEENEDPGLSISVTEDGVEVETEGGN